MVICVSHNWPSGALESIQALCEQLKFHVLVDFQKIESSLVLNMEDTHPNELANRLKAETLTNFLINEKIIEKYTGSGPHKY